MKDASQNAGVAATLLNLEQRTRLKQTLDREYTELRSQSGQQQRETVSLEEAQNKRLKLF
jgi:5-methyltetrahydrofolate--homocysteine methyltransferase